MGSIVTADDKKVAVCFVEHKLPGGAGDALAQACADYVNHWRDPSRSKLANACRCPSVLIEHRGYAFHVYGMALCECFVADPLFSINLLDAGDDQRIAQIARMTAALRKCFIALRTMYTLVTASDRMFEHMVLPYPREAASVHGGPVVHFSLQRRLTRLVFIATRDDDGVSVVVKFSRRYSEKGHRLCAASGLAPQLYAFQPLPGRWKMIVMEHLEGFKCVDDSSLINVLPSALERMKEALEVLHSADLVHGDFRVSNVMCNRAAEVRIIDFDWCGEENKDCYPPLMNPSIPWPQGAASLAPLNKQHDLEFLDSFRAFVTC
ncbi:MAG: hypothetical protein Q7U84_07340 [Polynucleobacter sp.]|nr:hypothetical protein [Polynucleobacter sp.]